MPTKSAKPFKPMLAATIEHQNQLQFPLYASPKVDGIRGIATLPAILSRRLKPIPNKSIQAAWQATLSAHPDLAHIFAYFDGELTISHSPTITPTIRELTEVYPNVSDEALSYSSVGSMPFCDHPFIFDSPVEYNANQSAIMSASPDPSKIYENYPTPVTGNQIYPNKPGIQITYWVFDTYKSPAKPYQYRYQNMGLALGGLSWKHNYGNLHIVRLPLVYIDNEDALYEYEALCLAAGFEGVIVRDPVGPYKFGRSTIRQFYLGKLKRFLDDEALIVDFEEQQQNTNQATTDALGETERSHHKANMVGKDTLGVLICDHPTFGLIRVGTGKGLTKKLRKEIWDNRDAYLGKLIKFKYFPIGMIDKPRLPIFLGFRDPLDT